MVANRIWLTWEDHRRSRELSSEFNAKYIPLSIKGGRIKRYFFLSILTIKQIFSEQPKLIFCQNPSLVLASMLVIGKKIFDYKVVVDRHSNFKLETVDSKKMKWRIFHFLSQFTVYRADITIVTNNYLASMCEDWGGRSIVLQDKIPTFDFSKIEELPSFVVKDGCPGVMFVTTFDDDEPLEEILDAAKSLEGVWCYITGNYGKRYTDEYCNSAFDNGIYFTGFISDSEYLALMRFCECVVVLTTKDFILNCGAYESIALEKPLVLSDTPTLKNYFGDAAFYVSPNAKGIAEGVRATILDTESAIGSVQREKKRLSGEWEQRAVKARLVVESLEID